MNFVGAAIGDFEGGKVFVIGGEFLEVGDDRFGGVDGGEFEVGVGEEHKLEATAV